MSTSERAAPALQELPATEDQPAQAIDPKGTALAERLLAAGIPVVVCRPCPGYRSLGGCSWRGHDKGTTELHAPKGWASTTAADCDLSGFRPGVDVLALVGGHGIDLVDVDTKAGGSVAHLPPFKSYGMTRTPSGGEHYAVPSSGYGKVSPFNTLVGHVGDYVGGKPDGSSRLLGYLPGSTRPKYPSGGYVEEVEWDVEACLAADPDPALVAALDDAGASAGVAEQHTDDSPLRPVDDGVHPRAQEAVGQQLARLDSLPEVWSEGDHWDAAHYEVACELVRYANSGWTGYTHDALRELFNEYARSDEGWPESKWDEKWRSAAASVGRSGKERPSSPEEDFAEPWAPAERVADAFAAAVEREAHRLRVQRAARELVTRAALEDTPVPHPTSLADFLAEPDEDVRYRVDRLLPTGGRVVFAAQNKAGKTTTIGNLVRCLVDGERFLDVFDVEPAERVVVLDNELDPRMIRSWLRDQAIVHTEAVAVLSLRGRLSGFNILDPVVRAEWARAIGPADLLVFDCLRPSLDALGLSEDKDAGRFLVALDELMAEAGVRELVVVHHMGHSGERSRGDSRILDWPDALWKIVRETAEDPQSARFFSAYGRDVDQPEALLAYNHDNRHLSLVGGSRTESRASALETDLLSFAADNPGSSLNGLVRGVVGDTNAKRKAVRNLLAGRLLRVEQEGQKHAHYVVQPGDDFTEQVG